MLVEQLLRHCAARTTKRFLAFTPDQGAVPQRPDPSTKYLLYIHIPFCDQLCPYCSFVRVKFDPALAVSYFEVLQKEILTYFSLGYQFDAVYVGGGTPTIWPEKLMEILSLVKSLWSIRQISTEANPAHLVPETLQLLQDIGVNRLSVGIQSFSNDILTSVHRSKPRDANDQIKQQLVRAKGMFDTLNVDMIFNFPNQTMAMLAEDIKTLKALDVDQVTYYPLMVSNFKQQEIEARCGKGHNRHEREAYDFIVDQLTGQYQRESVWCFSKRKGLIDEYIVNHDEYVGVGPGSWGYIRGTMYYNTFSVLDYIRRGQAGHCLISAQRVFSKRERLRYMFTLTMLRGSASLSDLKDKLGSHFWLFLGGELAALSLLRALVIRDRQLVLTRRGCYYWVILMGTLFSVVGDFRDTYASTDDALLRFRPSGAVHQPRPICKVSLSCSS